MTTLREAAQQALEALEHGQHTLKQVSENQWESRGQLAMDALRAALAEPVQEPVAWAAKAMELATDFGVESLRVGSHERKDSFLNNGVYTWETSMLRDKREAARDRLRQYLYTAPPQRKPLVDPAEYDDAGAAERYNRGLK